MRTRIVVALVVLVAACDGQQVAKKPALYVGQGMTPYSNGDRIQFPLLSGQDSQISVKIGNKGNAPLKVTTIQLCKADVSPAPMTDPTQCKAGWNRNVVLDPAWSSKDFPKTVVMGDLGGITVTARYTPGSGSDRDQSDSILMFTTNDFDHEIFTLVLSPVAKAPQIVVEPNNVTLYNATASNPETQVFKITNTGTDKLTIGSIDFLAATTDFDFVNRPSQGTEVEARDPVPGAPCEPPYCTSFEVRAIPKNPPAEVYVVINSDDLNSPTKVHVRAEAQRGQLIVSKTDPTCLDFSSIVPGSAPCTKVVTLQNIGEGSVVLSFPALDPVGAAGYSIAWYKVGTGQQDPGACGAYTGPALPEQDYALDPQKSVDVAVTYTAASGVGQNATLKFDYRDPDRQEQSVQLCGGAPKGDIEIAPLESQPLIFFAKAGETKQKSFMVFNKGNGELTVTDVTNLKTDDPKIVPFSLTFLKADGTTSATWDPTPMQPFEIREVRVTFDTTKAVQDGQNIPVTNGSVDVLYNELAGGGATRTVNFIGHNDDFIVVPATATSAAVYVKLPTANPGSGYSAKARDALTLVGSGSDGGDNTIPTNGYIWYVAKKPAQAQVFLNDPSGPARETVTVDKAGNYEFRLVVSAQSGSSYFYSDEASVTVTVTP